MKPLALTLLTMLTLGACSPGPLAEESVRETLPEATIEEPSQRTAPGPCDVASERAMAATIGAQIEALAAGDFEQAYQWAAPAFQLSVTVEIFETVIRQGYPSLLAARSYTLSDCVLFPQDLGNTVVTVRTTSQEVFTFYYEMINTADGWRILGAAEISPVSSGT